MLSAMDLEAHVPLCSVPRIWKHMCHCARCQVIGLNFSEMASGTTQPHSHTTPQSHHTPDHTNFLFVVHCSSFFRPHLIDFMFHGSGRSDFLQFAKKKKKKKKWAPCACVRAPICVVLMQLCLRKKINDIHGDFFFFFFFLPVTRVTIFAGKFVKHEIN